VNGVTAVLIAAFLAVVATTAQAAEPVTIARLLADPTPYHLRTVSLRGTAHQVQIITPSPPSDQFPRLDFQCYFIHPAYTFVLADDTGFLQITVRARPPCVSRFSPAEPPEVVEGEPVSIDAQITVLHQYSDGSNRYVVQALALGINHGGK
jgi:hypothetical protein